MKNLFMWDYQGKTEIGFAPSESDRKGNYFLYAIGWGVSQTRNRAYVTNLRPAKVVDADAVVIDASQFEIIQLAVQEGIDGIYEWQRKSPFEAARARGALYAISKIVRGYPITLTPLPITKTYLTTEQFITVWNSLDDEKRKELPAARYAARDDVWYTAWDAVWDAVWYAAWDADLAVLVKDKISDEHFEILTKPWTSCGLSLFAEDWQDVLNPKVLEPKNFGAIVEAEDGTADSSSIHRWVKINWKEWIAENPGGSKPLIKSWNQLHNPTIISEGVEG